MLFVIVLYYLGVHILIVASNNSYHISCFTKSCHEENIFNKVSEKPTKLKQIIYLKLLCCFMLYEDVWSIYKFGFFSHILYVTNHITGCVTLESETHLQYSLGDLLSAAAAAAASLQQPS